MEHGLFDQVVCEPAGAADRANVDSMAELNELLIGYDEVEDARRISNRTMSVGQHYAFEATLLRPLPAELF